MKSKSEFFGEKRKDAKENESLESQNSDYNLVQNSELSMRMKFNKELDKLVEDFDREREEIIVPGSK